MSSANYEALIAEFPSEQDTLDRLIAAIAGKKAALSIEQLLAWAKPHSYPTFLALLGALVHAGVLRDRVQVFSPWQHMIAEFDGGDELPSELVDEHAGGPFRVLLENVKGVFRSMLP